MYGTKRSIMVLMWDSWMERWQEYVNQDEYGKTCLLSHSDVDPPGPITNEDILEVS